MSKEIPLLAEVRVLSHKGFVKFKRKYLSKWLDYDTWTSGFNHGWHEGLRYQEAKRQPNFHPARWVLRTSTDILCNKCGCTIGKHKPITRALDGEQK